jgi:hypothetical protein
VFKPSRRAAVIAASLALGLSCVSPYAQASRLGGDDSDSPTVEELGLPLVDDVLGDELLDDLPLVDDVLGDELLDDLPLVDDVLGDELLDDLPLVDDVLGDDGDLLAAEGVVEVLTDVTDLAAIVPGGASLSEILEAFSDSGSIVPGLQVLDEMGILGILGAL